MPKICFISESTPTILARIEELENLEPFRIFEIYKVDNLQDYVSALIDYRHTRIEYLRERLINIPEL